MAVIVACLLIKVKKLYQNIVFLKLKTTRCWSCFKTSSSSPLQTSSMDVYIQIRGRGTNVWNHSERKHILNSCSQICLLVRRLPEKHDGSWKHWDPLPQRHFGLNTKCVINSRSRLDDIRVEARLWRVWLLLSTTCFMTSDLIWVRSPYWLSEKVLRLKEGPIWGSYGCVYIPFGFNPRF